MNVHGVAMSEPYYTVNQSTDERRKDGSFNIRSSHNKAKLILLMNDGQRKRLLDLGSGKGGDEGKWQSLCYHEVFALDIDVHGLRELESRHKKSQGRGRRTRGRSPPPLQVHTVCADMSEKLDAFIPHDYFDMAAAMFSIHFVCGSEAQADNGSESPGLSGTVRNVANSLRAGGMFVGITLDAAKLSDDVMTFHTQDGDQFARFRAYPGKRKVEVLIRSISEHPRWEYLVDFEHLEACLHEQGMRFATQEEAVKLGLGSACGSLLNIAPTGRLCDEERRYTDMYRYWVAKKP